MATFTINQLNPKEAEYTFEHTDLLLGSIGTSTADLSSVKISFEQFSKLYVFDQYAAKNNLSVNGSISGVMGLSANNQSLRTINFKGLPTADTGLQTGDLFTRTAAQLGGSGSTKVLCIK